MKLNISSTKEWEVVSRLKWAGMYMGYVIDSLFGPRMRYQVVIRVSKSGSRGDVVKALDALKQAYEEN